MLRTTFVVLVFIVSTLRFSCQCDAQAPGSRLVTAIDKLVTSHEVDDSAPGVAILVHQSGKLRCVILSRTSNSIYPSSLCESCYLERDLDCCERGALQNAALIWDEKRNQKLKVLDKDEKWRDKVVELKFKDCRIEPHVLVMRAGQNGLKSKVM